jgi:DNA-binding NarL/FixJ family response regulator
MGLGPPDGAGSSGSSPSRKIRVLLADDHPPMLDRIVALLATEFTVVGAVKDGEEAVTAASLLQPDVLVFDVSMPRLSGFDAATRIRLGGSAAPVVFLTVHSEPEFQQAAWEAGALGYVRKSHMGADLIPAIRAVLLGKRFISASIDPDCVR